MTALAGLLDQRAGRGLDAGLAALLDQRASLLDQRRLSVATTMLTREKYRKRGD